MTKGTLPQDLPAEDSVLGAAMLDPNALLSALEVLLPEHFYNQNNALIFGAMLRLWRAGMPVDQITVSHELAIQDKLDVIGGGSRLSWLAGNTTSTVHTPYYAASVRRMADLREAIGTMTTAIQTLYSAREDAETVKAQMAEMLLRGTNIARKEWSPIADAMTLEEQKPGLPLPWPDLDEYLQGLRPGKMYLLAGRPSMGKSTVHLNIAYHVALKGMSVIIATLEDNKEGIADRLLRMELNIDDEELRKRKKNALDDAALIDAIGKISDRDIYISESLDATNAVARIVAFHAQKPADLIIVDYIQLFAAATKSHSRYDQVSDMSIQFARTAQRLNVPIIAVSQLNRQPDDRPDHRPQLSDLRETGQLEQDAHAVIFVWRPGAYYPQSSKDWRPEYETQLNVIVAKNKDGPTGAVKLNYDMPSGNIRSWSMRRE